MIYLNDRSGGFPQVVTGVDLGGALKPIRAVVGDFTGDGSADDIYLISESPDANEMLLRNDEGYTHALQNNGCAEGDTAARCYNDAILPFPVPGASRDVVIGDFNGAVYYPVGSDLTALLTVIHACRLYQAMEMPTTFTW